MSCKKKPVVVHDSVKQASSYTEETKTSKFFMVLRDEKRMSDYKPKSDLNKVFFVRLNLII